MEITEQTVLTLNNPNTEEILENIDSEECRQSTKLTRFFRKYFLEGQKLESEDPFVLIQHSKSSVKPASPNENACRFQRFDSPENQRRSNHHYSVKQKKSETGGESCEDGGDGIETIFHRHRKLFAFLIPFAFMHLAWWTLAIRYDVFRLYPTRFEMPLTMILGATVAGMTSEGGGAVAFPVMTLLLKIEPKDARDFSLMIQSCGMTSAAFTIVWMGLKVEWNTIIVGSLGALFGIVFGLEYVDSLLTGPEKKMLFVAIWFSFALSLFLLNSQKKRTTFSSIQRVNAWKLFVLFLTGFVGGICSAFAGSGVDICSFSLLTLLFRVSEKVATPTSVVLMAVNTCVGFFWRELIMNDVSELTWEYFSVSVPVVVICAPMGSLIASHFHRLVLATFVYVLEVAAVVGFLMTRPEPQLIWAGVVIVAASFAFFLGLSKLGRRIHADLCGDEFSASKPRPSISLENSQKSKATYRITVNPHEAG